MTIFMQIFLGSLLLGACSLLHILLLVFGIRILRRSHHPQNGHSPLMSSLVLLSIAFATVLTAHTMQGWVWAVTLLSMGALPDLKDAIYFALVTYTTVGYGDVTLASGHRIFAAMAAVTGMLNFGLSTAFLVGTFERIINPRAAAASLQKTPSKQ